MAQERGLTYNGRKEGLVQRLKLDDFDDAQESAKEKASKEEKEERNGASSPVAFHQVRIGNGVFIRKEPAVPREPEIDYSNKDNSKLRVLLEDRNFISDGKSREEMISLLQ